MRQKKGQHLSWRHSCRQHGALLPDTPWFLRRTAEHWGLEKNLRALHSKCSFQIHPHSPEQITLTDWLPACLRTPLWGWRGGSCTLNTPTHCIIGSLSNLSGDCNALLRSWTSQCIWKIYRQKKTFFWHWHLLFDQTCFQSNNKKHLESYLCLKSPDFISDAYSIPTSSKILKKERAVNVQACGWMTDIISVLGEMCTPPWHSDLSRASG